MDFSSCGTPEARQDREVFFRGVFGQHQGIICIGISPVPEPGAKRKMHQRFFDYPAQLGGALDLIDAHLTRADIYFCPQLLSEHKLTKGTVTLCPTIWADLDDCPPGRMQVPPTIAWETSPGRFQAIWRLEEALDPPVAEELARRIAYFHAEEGADRSGWDLTQFLRVPRTGNFKYVDPLAPINTPVVRIVAGTPSKYRTEEFSAYPPVKRAEFLDLPFPEVIPTDDPLELIQKYRRQINTAVFELFSTEPKGTWSEQLWRLLVLCFEAGMELPEVLRVANEAACNKYRRDGRDISYLWKDVCRAYVRVQQNASVAVLSAVPQIEIATDEEVRAASQHTSFLTRYIEWASALGDAAPQYHQAGAFVALSSMLSGNVRLPTSFGTMIPNMWFMILADTTLTRKSTAMDIAMDLVNDVDDDCLLATDGSLEGLLQSLSTRPGRASVFLRDEFSGLLEMMTKRDYYAGMAEMLTKLYDGKIQKRILRRETVEVREPVLILFAGGIRTRVQGLLTPEHVASGFIPRFIFITAESDTSRLRALGPPTLTDMTKRNSLLNELSDMKAHYDILDGNTRTTMKFNAELTTDAWARYNKLEADLLKAGLEAERPELMTPLFDRLAKSILKGAVLIAASRQREESPLVEESDLVSAIVYGMEWREHAIEVVNGVGQSVWERELEKVFRAIQKYPGIQRAKLMQNYHLTAKTADVIFDTLIQRGLVQPSKFGGRTVYHALVKAEK